jgi:plasmid replication initiation protein
MDVPTSRRRATGAPAAEVAAAEPAGTDGADGSVPRGGGRAGAGAPGGKDAGGARSGSRGTRSSKGGGKSAARTGGRRAIERRSGGRVSVTQANPLALSRQEMGLLTKRLLVLALSDITRDDHDLEPIRITAWEYAQIFNIRGKSIYNRIEDSARELLEQTVQIKEPNGDWIMFQWVSEARYDSGRDSKDKLACIELKIHDKLKPYLLQLRRDFSIIPTDQLLSFESFNSMRLFEVLYTASYGGEKRHLDFDVDDLKLRLGLDGKYERFKDFTYVLDKAQGEFAKYTSLTFTYEGRKVGRKYQNVSIVIEKNDVFQPRVRLPDSIARRVQREGDTEAQLRALQAADALRDVGWALDPDRSVAQHGAQRVIDVVRYARSLQRKSEQTGRPIANLAGFVHSLLQQGIEPPPAEPEVVDARLTRDAVRGIVSGIVDAFDQQRRERAKAAWEALSADQRDLVHTLMQATGHRFTLERIEAAGWTGPLYEANRIDVLLSHGFLTLPPYLSDVVAYADHGDLLDEYPAEDRQRLLAELREAGA